jgi:hypothetical protein
MTRERGRLARIREMVTCLPMGTGYCQPEGAMRYLISIFVVLLLCACASQPPADMRTTLATISGSPSPGYARVYVFAGNTFVGTQPNSYLNSFDVLIDGVLIGGVNSGEVISADLPIGRHIIVRKIKTVWGTSTDPVGLTVDLVSGQKRYIAVDRYMTGVQLTDLSFAIARGKVVGASADMEAISPSRAPGDYLEERSDGPQIAAGSKLVLADQRAITLLRAK